MAFLSTPFEVNSIPADENSTGFSPLPAGWYSAEIAKTELKNTRNWTGQYIWLKLKINGPTHAGRVVFCNLNIRNQSGAAEKIGIQQLGSLLRSIGLDSLQDTDALIGHHVQIKLAVKEAANGYDASNDVKAFKASGSAPAAPTAPRMPTTAAATPAQASKTPPWAAKKPAIAQSLADDDVPF